MALSRTHSLLKALLLAAALGAGLPASWAAPQESSTAPVLADDTSDQLNSAFRPAYEANDWKKAIAALDEILPKVGPESYDAAYVYRAEGTIYLQSMSNATLGLPNMERALAIDDRKHYFTQEVVQDILFLISQYSYNEAATVKDTKAKIRFFARTVETLERWLQHADAKSLTQDNYYFVAMVYFALGQGTELGAEQKPDKAMMEKALAWIEKGLRSVTHPRDNFYQLKIAGLLQLDRMKEAADCLELQLKRKPDNKGYWQQLASIYLQLAQAADVKKDTAAAYSYNVRAIVTIERAQKLGFMTTPAENFSLVSIYSNINQYLTACELLDAGLTEETIESNPQNWTTLGAWYQLIHRNDKSIQAYLTATKLFPTNTEIEYQLAQVYLGVPDEPNAFEHIKACIAKGGTEKPHVGWLFYSYVAMDLQKYDEALKGAREALAAATKIGATDAINQAVQMEATIKANLQDIENRKLQMKR